MSAKIKPSPLAAALLAVLWALGSPALVEASAPLALASSRVLKTADPFAMAPQLDLPSLTQQLRAMEEREIAASECVALCELAAGIDAHPFGLVAAVPLNRSEDAWGNYRFTSELTTSHNRFGFTGHYWDKEASLYYAKARFYDPFTARFTQADSFLGTIDDPPSLHRYAYANDNPTRFVDPTGYVSESIDEGQSTATTSDGSAETVEEKRSWFGEKWEALKAQSNAVKDRFVEAASEQWRSLFPQQKRDEARDRDTAAAFEGDPTATAIASRNIGESFKQTTDEVVRRGAADAFDLAENAAGAKVLAGSLGVMAGGLKSVSGALGVWAKDPIRRGILIERRLAKTDYKDWHHVGATMKGKFPLVDFQKGDSLVSLKTVDTAGKSWRHEMHLHIEDLSTRGATANRRAANLILDIRVPPGGKTAAESLIKYGQGRGVTVVIKEIQ